MGLHLYCILPDDAPPPSLRGLDDVPVEDLHADGVTIWLSRHDTRPAADLATLRRHNDVAQAALTERVTPVPLRFGQWLETERAATERVAAQAGHWLDLLERLRGHAEFGVLVTLAGDDTVTGVQDVHHGAATPGTEHMRALARRKAESDSRRAAAERIVEEIGVFVNGLAVRTHVDLQRLEQGTVGMAHLVAWRDADAYHTAVRASEGRPTAQRYLFTGPWPPYSFVD